MKFTARWERKTMPKTFLVIQCRVDQVEIGWLVCGMGK